MMWKDAYSRDFRVHHDMPALAGAEADRTSEVTYKSLLEAYNESYTLPGEEGDPAFHLVLVAKWELEQKQKSQHTIKWLDAARYQLNLLVSFSDAEQRYFEQSRGSSRLAKLRQHYSGDLNYLFWQFLTAVWRLYTNGKHDRYRDYQRLWQGAPVPLIKRDVLDLIARRWDILPKGFLGWAHQFAIDSTEDPPNVASAVLFAEMVEIERERIGVWPHLWED